MAAAHSIYTLLKDIFFLLEDGDRRFFQQYDLTVTRFYALFHLNKQPGLTLRELADCMICDKSNVTRVIQGLEREGLVWREPHESDGRAYRLYLTDDGRDRLHGVDVSHRQFNDERLRGILSHEQYDHLEGMLRHMAGEISARLENAN